MVAVSYEPDWMTEGTAVFSCVLYLRAIRYPRRVVRHIVDGDNLTGQVELLLCIVPESDTLAKHLVDGDNLTGQVKLLLCTVPESDTLKHLVDGDNLTGQVELLLCTVPESETFAKHLVDGDNLAGQLELLLPRHLLQSPRQQ